MPQPEQMHSSKSDANNCASSKQQAWLIWALPDH